MISKGTPGFGGVRAIDISKAAAYPQAPRGKRSFGAPVGNYGDNPYSQRDRLIETFEHGLSKDKNMSRVPELPTKVLASNPRSPALL